MPKKIKVKIKKETYSRWIDGVKYSYGDVVEIPVKWFDPNTMEKFKEPKPAPKAKPKGKEATEEEAAPKKGSEEVAES